jgi:GcrA cell cycle regulator
MIGASGIKLPPQSTESWTDERVTRLRKLWSDGLSAAQIAAELGGVSRNAVIGKVHRLGLNGRAKSPREAASRPRRPRTHSVLIARQSKRELALAAVFESARETGQEPAPEATVIPFGQRRSLLELTESTCRWPIGDPADKDQFFFCGGPALGGFPYCRHHCRIGFAAPAERKPPTPHNQTRRRLTASTWS